MDNQSMITSYTIQDHTILMDGRPITISEAAELLNHYERLKNVRDIAKQYGKNTTAEY